ncbi:NAD(P)-dependent oxidoreductase [Clostridium hydrogeniformans]|uniref:NAD(P)-dependent oxidoreductase n=1 Tax=Clostridium hydrogeniformans TaxID=349933 RepID=UPI0004871F93|nr:NAD(P)-dependent oxidoreductase [Clostridium hydrogeniformans]
MEVYGLNKLLKEADRCYKCKNARCSKNCPVNTPIPEIIELFQEGKLKEAGEILFNNNPLSVVCALICPHEKQCFGHCIKGIKDEPIPFHEMEYIISNEFLNLKTFTQREKLNKKVAIIGSGPAGITIAFKLALKGYDITLFDAHDEIGGVLRYGIPEFRLPKDILEKIKIFLLQLGVKIRPNTLIGPVITLEDLKNDGYESIFIGTGVWKPNKLNLKGESLGHVHYAIDYLKNPKVYNLGNRVCVIGAGDVAMDAARTALRQGSKEVYILYRKTFEDMPATKHELNMAKEEGVKFQLLKSPIEITDEGVKYLEVSRSLNEDGKVVVSTIEDSEGLFKADSVIVSVSQGPRANIVSNTTGLEINKWGLLITDDVGNTTKEGVFASGDVVTGARTVVEAVKYSKKVAEAMDDYMKNKK